jgi:DnaJ-class molecular chaperone
VKHKPCDNCGGDGRIEGERFCKACRKVITDKIRNDHHEAASVRTLSRRGTEDIGRKMHMQPVWDNINPRNEQEPL